MKIIYIKSRLFLNQCTNTAFNMDLFGNAHNQTLPEHC